jgi:hypothetical protein
LGKLLKAGPHFIPAQVHDGVVEHAVLADRLSVVRLLYEAGWRLPDAMCRRVLLSLAKSIDMLEYLLFTMGCEICSTVLHKECNSGKLEHVSLLIWAGSDVDGRDRHGLTPMAYALHGVSLYPQLMCRYLEHCGIARKHMCLTVQQRVELGGVRGYLLHVSSGLHPRPFHIQTEDLRCDRLSFNMYLCHMRHRDSSDLS